MEKSIIITIMADKVNLKDLDVILKKIDDIFEGYAPIRVSATIQNEQLIPTFPR